jgi:Immunity protein 7
MFEFHGWATIRVAGDNDEAETCSIGCGPEFDALKRLRAAVNVAHDEFCSFDTHRTGNGLIVLSVHGLRNHPYQPVIELFRWVAVELPDSYGLLYIHDDEALNREDSFSVYRVARGKLNLFDDVLLSPCIPTIEAPDAKDA